MSEDTQSSCTVNTIDGSGWEINSSAVMVLNDSIIITTNVFQFIEVETEEVFKTSFIFIIKVILIVISLRFINLYSRTTIVAVYKNFKNQVNKVYKLYKYSNLKRIVLGLELTQKLKA